MSTKAAADPISEPPTKRQRTKLACSRCQTRKIRCDGGIPKCSNCHRAGVACSDGKSSFDGGISRNEAISLHSQVQRLESVLRSRCPGLDLERVKEGHVTVDTVVAAELPQNASTSGNRAVTGNDNATSNPDGTYAETQDLSNDSLAHEIGLVPMSSGGTRYIGPSSGFSFARLVFAKARHNRTPGTSSRSPDSRAFSPKISIANFNGNRNILPETVDDALQLVTVYFDFIHFAFPILHEADHKQLIHKVYHDRQSPPMLRFQVHIVSAISAAILSQRTRCAYSGEGIAAAAMAIAADVDFQSSLQGLQCLLLVYVYALYSPSLGLNPWHLNYQSLATVLDLGLQRNVPVSKSISAVTREMRTRVFWVAYSIDRSLATALGRPIGLRDEACDVRLPLLSASSPTEEALEALTEVDKHVTNRDGFILFRLAQLNSEMKYILHSISREVPRYAYPQITDISTWQADIYNRLQEIELDMNRLIGRDQCDWRICMIQYHELVMLLFRPSPRIRKPDTAALRHCFRSAQESIQIWKELYDSNRLIYSWTMVHSLCLSAITMLYSIWMSPDIASEVKVDVLMATTNVASNLLTVAGEHWPEAKSSRDSLSSLSTATIRWLFERRLKAPAPTTEPSTELPELETSDPASYEFDLPNFDAFLDSENLATFLGAPDSFNTDFSVTVDGMFSDYHPLFDLDTYIDPTVGM